MNNYYLLIYYTGAALLNRDEERFEDLDEAHDFIFENKIKDYKLYRLFEESNQ